MRNNSGALLATRSPTLPFRKGVCCWQNITRGESFGSFRQCKNLKIRLIVSFRKVSIIDKMMWDTHKWTRKHIERAFYIEMVFWGLKGIGHRRKVMAAFYQAVAVRELKCLACSVDKGQDSNHSICFKIPRPLSTKPKILAGHANNAEAKCPSGLLWVDLLYCLMQVSDRSSQFCGSLPFLLGILEM